MYFLQHAIFLPLLHLQVKNQIYICSLNLTKSLAKQNKTNTKQANQSKTARSISYTGAWTKWPTSFNGISQCTFLLFLFKFHWNFPHGSNGQHICDIHKRPLGLCRAIVFFSNQPVNQSTRWNVFVVSLGQWIDLCITFQTQIKSSRHN